MSRFLSSFSLKTRLTAAFATLCLILLISLSVTVFKSKQLDRATTTIAGQSIPVAFAGAQLASDINATMAALRGWVLTNDESFKDQRGQLWEGIQKDIQLLDGFLGDDQLWTSLKSDLLSFETVQKQVEDIAHSNQDLPATQLLNSRVTPLTDRMLSSMSQVYIEEVDRPATPERKRMLAQMGDIRGAIAVVTGNMRAYLLTGESHYAEQYKAVWTWALDQLSSLQMMSLSLSKTQLDNLNDFSQAATEVTPLFEELVTLRSAPDWNRSRALLVSDVIPLSRTILQKLTNAETGLVSLKRTEMNLAATHAQAATQDLTITAYILAGLGVIFAIAMAVLSTRAIIDPVEQMTKAMTRLADGENGVPIPGTDRQDEIGKMAQALRIFRENGEERLRLEQQQNEQQQAREARAKRIETLSQDFSISVRDLLSQTQKATRQMEESAQSMQTTATQTLDQTRTAGGATEKTRTNIEEVAGATDNLSQSFVQINQNATSSVQVIQAAIEKGENASETVGWMSEASARIGEVVKMIEDIAAQTNLLALNATIEAARAGQAGKGFAVVAGEVKNLANQTAHATQEITSHIARMQETTERSVAAIQDVCDTISEVGQQAGDVRDTVNIQSEATHNISGNLSEVVENSRVISTNIGNVEQAARQTSEAANDVSQAVSDVSNQSRTLNNQVENFLDALKTA